MADIPLVPQRPMSPFKQWLLEGHTPAGAGSHPHEVQHHQHAWWQVMCLTGVDYFSTLGYQPGIAAIAAGALSPLATLILVLLTLFGALPIYNYVANASPHGEGSIAMLEHLLTWWKGKLFVLCLIGFAATDFIITITLSAADAAEHLINNPFTPPFLHHSMGVTLFMVALLGAIFLKGFKEAIGLAVGLVAIYLLLNFVVIADGLYQVAQHPHLITDWKHALDTMQNVHGNPFLMIAVSLLLFPKLALGLSGFETGVAVMPLIKGDSNDEPRRPAGRIRNARRLLLCAALIMSVFLITSSLVTTILIPADEFKEGGHANGRALAYLAHLYLGNAFGTIYDISTILILWFAGASAMAGLLNIVPRYLPRYGMAPDWARATRPLVLVFIAIAFTVTVIFKADVTAQGGAYATGVLVLMSSAAVAVTLSVWAKKAGGIVYAYGLIALVFIYTTVINVIERPEGIKIASFFIGGIIVVSLLSRIYRSTELRTDRVELDDLALRFIEEAATHTHELSIIANDPDARDHLEYRHKEQEMREDNHMPPEYPLLFLEVTVCDPSQFSDVLTVRGSEDHGYKILRAESSTVPNAIAALLLDIRNRTGKIPHIYFSWGEGNPFLHLITYLLSGRGDVAPVTREVLRKAERDPKRRPAVHVGG